MRLTAANLFRKDIIMVKNPALNSVPIDTEKYLAVLRNLVVQRIYVELTLLVKITKPAVNIRYFHISKNCKSDPKGYNYG
mgnify:CR=1 FL=1